jgi:DNA-3-methyladenine glycosylase
MAVTRDFVGHDLTSSDELWLAALESAQSTDVKVGARIGVDYAGDDWRDRHLRFWLDGNPSVSRVR